MKKVLFLTTALIATGSMAAADVRISGYGRFGLDYDDVNDGSANGKTSITSRLRLQFDMSAETDGGVAFGARYRAQAESRDNVAGGATFNGGRFFAAYEGFTLQVGNILGAVENARGLYLETRTAGIGIDGAGFNSVVTNMAGNNFDWDAYSSAGTGVNGVEVLYDGANWGVHLSYSDASSTASPSPTGDGETNTAINGYYQFGDWTVALAYNDESDEGGDNDIIFASVQGDIGGFGLRLAYAEMDNVAGAALDDSSSKLGLYGIFDIGAASTIVAYVTSEDTDVVVDANGETFDGTGFGIHYSYDLGGGVSFEAGARRTSTDQDALQAGVYFSF